MAIKVTKPTKKQLRDNAKKMKEAIEKMKAAKNGQSN